MVIRAQFGTIKTNPRFHGHTSHISPLLMFLNVALFDPNWRDAMYDEYNALIRNSTWILVLKPPNANVYGVDCDDKFSSVVEAATIRTVLSLALYRNWSIHYLDVKNAFLNGDLSETGYMYHPPGFVDPRFPHHVCRLQRSLYGLKQAPHACGTLDFVLQLYASSTSSLVAYSDADWVGCPTTRRSTSVAKAARLRNLLCKLHMPLLSATLVYCDNVGAIYLTANLVQHQQSKHIEIDIHLVCDMVSRGHVCIFMCHLVTNMLI
nr:ribonuclease H-like domain-containing protein [Tanacetum cinerariifolium]